MDILELAFIMDRNYINQTLTTITSIIKNKADSCRISFNIILVDIMDSELLENKIKMLSNSKINFNFIHESSDKYSHLHKFREDVPCVATTAALLKFDLPQLLPHLDKVLYLDGDIIVKKDLQELYSVELEDYLVAAVVDSGTMYYKHEYVRLVQNYFNSGVMLLNLKKMRKDAITEKLIYTKLERQDSLLMDQNVFNIIFDGKVKLLPIKYNFLYVSLVRARNKFSINNINELYKTSYSSIMDIYNDSYIIHFSSKDKPWKYESVPAGELWEQYYRDVQDKFDISFNNYKDKNIKYISFQKDKTYSKKQIKVSVIVPIYNIDKYLYASLSSIINQSLSDIEIICIDDGSKDSSLSVLKLLNKIDNRLKIIALEQNMGQSVARNIGLDFADGEYIYFFDGDDSLEETALEYMYNYARKEMLDLILFEGDAYYEDNQLKESFPYYLNGYKWKQQYDEILCGEKMYIDLVHNNDYKVSPCLQFIKKDVLIKNDITFLEGVTYEDNLFSLQVILSSTRVGCINKTFFHRRVRRNSTITSNDNYREYRDKVIVLSYIYEYIMRTKLSQEALFTVKKQMLFFHKTIIKSYNKLSFEQKHNPFIDDARVSLTSSLLFTGISINYNKCDNPYDYMKSNTSIEFLLKNKELEQDLNNIKKGYSFRIGRIITWLPRKIRGGIQCYRDNGLKYTIKRTLYHIRNIG